MTLGLCGSSDSSMFDYGSCGLGLIPTEVFYFFFSHDVYNAFGAKNVMFLVCLFFLFPYIQGQDERVITEVQLLVLICNTLSECFIITNTFFNLMHMYFFIYSSTVAESPTKFVCATLCGKFHFVRATPSTGNNKDSISCLSVSTENRSKR